VTVGIPASALESPLEPALDPVRRESIAAGWADAAFDNIEPARADSIAIGSRARAASSAKPASHPIIMHGIVDEHRQLAFGSRTLLLEDGIYRLK
jgi:hypothetical protein